jgi:DNA topoisomerase-3
LTGLQRLANLRFGLTAQATLEAAQTLYERHKAITYPRTDSNYLPQTLKAGLLPLLGRLNRAEMAPLIAPLVAVPPGLPPVSMARIIKDSEVSDHHAIIPTGAPLPPMGVSEAERQIYGLIVRRFVAAFYPPARIGLGTLTAKVAGHTFVGRGRMVLEPGWHVVEPPAAGASADKLLPSYRRADAVAVQSVKVDGLKTRPPPRLNEAALLGAMERAGAAMEQAEVRLALKEQGLGTPATRAAIIENLKRRSYVRLDGRFLRPSPEGRALLTALPVADLKSAELTGRWESKLSRVAKGELSRQAFMEETHAFVKTMVATILASVPEAPASSAPRGPHKPLGRAAPRGACPICGEGQVRRGDTLGCARGRACTFVIFPQVAGRTLRPEEVAQLLQGERTATLKGFVSRAGKPFAAALELDDRGRVALVFANGS